MNLADTKLADITTGNKVRGSALGNLASIPSSAGLIPIANIPVTLASIPNSSLLPINLASWIDGAAMRNIQSMPSLAGQLSYYSIVTSLASGGTIKFNGVDKFVGAIPVSSNIALFTASGTFTAPVGVTKVYISAVAGGGSGAVDAGGGASGGGGGGASILNYPFTVVPGNNYTVTIGAGGTGIPSAISNGNAGGNTSFDTITLLGGAGGTATLGGIGGSNAATPLPLFSVGATTSTQAVTAVAYKIPGGNGGAGNGTNAGAGGSTPFGSGTDGASVGAASAAASANTGAGSGGSKNGSSGNGGSGVVIVYY